MKKLILILIIMGFSSLMFAQNNSISLKKDNFFFANFSPVFFPPTTAGNFSPQIGFGYGEATIKKQRRREYIVDGSLTYFDKNFMIGEFLLRVNFFNNKKRIGFFKNINVGFDVYCDNEDDDYGMGVLPNISVGYGYSWKAFRISLDAGLKYSIANLNFGYVF